jgi:hypothetical protein
MTVALRIRAVRATAIAQILLSGIHPGAIGRRFVEIQDVILATTRSNSPLIPLSSTMVTLACASNPSDLVKSR